MRKEGKGYKEIGLLLGIHEETAGLYGRKGCNPKRLK
jgi:DNA-binding CsgD family transcriptional regulator